MPSGGDHEVYIRVLRGVGVRGGSLGFQAGTHAGSRSSCSFTYLWPALEERARRAVALPCAWRARISLFPRSYDFGALS